MDEEEKWVNEVLVRLGQIERWLESLTLDLYANPLGVTAYYLAAAESSVAAARQEVDQYGYS